MNNYISQPPPQMYYPQDFEVSYEEKRKIRRNYNTIGIVLLVLYILTAVLCTGLYDAFAPEVTYDENNMMVFGFTETLIGCCTPAITAILVFLGYCLITRYNPRELFSTQNVSAGSTGGYVLIVLMLQQVSILCTIFISSFLWGIGLEVPNVNYIFEHTPSVYAVDIIATVILAPIGEELIYRGVVLRCAAKVSQKFAIFLSAFIFGIMHGNPYQFVLGFLIGIPLAMVTIKTGSIIPAIICHMANNTVVSLANIIDYFNEDISYAITLICIPVFLVIGLVAFVMKLSSGQMKMPEYTQHHKKRTFPIMITSWSMIVIMIFYIFDLVSSIQPIAETALETVS